MRVRVARIGKPFGIAGQVTVQVATDEPEMRFVPGAEVFCDGNPLRLDSVRRSGPRWILGFAGVSGREAAEELRGSELFADVADTARPSGAQEWYDRDLVGLTCSSPQGERLGEVAGVNHLPGQDLLVVRTPAGHDALVPFVAAIVTRVDDSGIVLDTPGGLLEPDLEAREV
jgi:16S rRNA processing protein RimM